MTIKHPIYTKVCAYQYAQYLATTCSKSYHGYDEEQQEQEQELQREEHKEHEQQEEQGPLRRQQPQRQQNQQRQQQQQQPISEENNGDEEDHWRFADFGVVGELSRDGSIHATDEVFNSVSHLSATLLSILGTGLLVSQASAQANAWKIVAFSIYGASLVFLFGASTLHHSIIGPKRLEYLLRMLDYIAIYPLIAGTFTPLCLVYFHHSIIGWTFLGVIWIISICSMIVTAIWFHKIPKWLSMTMYITLGWMGACMTYWLLPKLGISGFLFLLAGGVLYTAGGYVYTTEYPPSIIPGKFGFHEIWHIAVVLAAFCHWCLMYFYVLQWQTESNHHNIN